MTEFVEHARFASHSWAEIGAALGVSRQAAQQRFPVPHREYPQDAFSDELHDAMRALGASQAAERIAWTPYARKVIALATTPRPRTNRSAAPT